MAARIGLLPPIGKGSVANEAARPEACEGVGVAEGRSLTERESEDCEDSRFWRITGEGVDPIASRQSKRRIAGPIRHRDFGLRANRGQVRFIKLLDRRFYFDAVGFGELLPPRGPCKKVVQSTGPRAARNPIVLAPSDQTPSIPPSIAQIGALFISLNAMKRP